MEKFTVVLFISIASFIVVAKANFLDNAFDGDFDEIDDRSVFRGNSDVFDGIFDRGSDENLSIFHQQIAAKRRKLPNARAKRQKWPNGVPGRKKYASTKKPSPRQKAKDDKERRKRGKKPKSGPGSRTFDMFQRFDPFRRSPGGRS